MSSSAASFVSVLMVGRLPSRRADRLPIQRSRSRRRRTMPDRWRRRPPSSMWWPSATPWSTCWPRPPTTTCGLDLVKGSMALVDLDRAEAIYAAMGPTTEVSGGSAANTAAGVAALGGRVGFLGKVADDELGQVFIHDIRSIGVAFDPVPTPAVPGDGGDRPLPGAGDRRRRTHHGHPPRGGLDFGPDDLHDGHLVVGPGGLPRGLPVGAAVGQGGHARAIEVAHAPRRLGGAGLSDPFCVERHQREFLELLRRRRRRPVRQRGRDHVAVRRRPTSTPPWRRWTRPVSSPS